MSTDLDSMEAATRATVETAHRAYMECAVWLATDDEGESLSGDYGTDDIEEGTRAAMLEDVAAFLTTAWDEGMDLSPLEPEQIGHDLFLTRNRHGAGFWDRGLGELGDKLTDIAHPYGDFGLYLADRGTLAGE